LLGVLNLTPDSFSDGGLYNTLDAALAQTECLLREGADIIDVGAASSRPGAPEVPEDEELRRIETIGPRLVERFPDALFSVDTWRARVAAVLLDAGFHFINDISAGRFEPEVLTLAAQAHAPVILMHMQGTPPTMQLNPHYTQPVDEVIQFLVERVQAAYTAGVRDVIVDPGFGFGKSQAHNLELLAGLDRLAAMGLPVLVGISRKRMVRALAGGESPLELASVQGALHLEALMRGARLLRVHDVAPARRIVDLFLNLSGGAVHNRVY
jgi:dihydropteroate synthase